MDLSQDNMHNPLRIKSYVPGKIELAQASFSTPIILNAKEIFKFDCPESIEHFSESFCNQLIELKPDIILIGTGEERINISDEQLYYFQQHHIGVECMSSHFACRTFNILLAEERHFIAVIYP